MSESLPDEPAKNDSQPAAAAPQPATPANNNANATRHQPRKETHRWWIKLFVQPALLLACGATLIVGLGVAQRSGFISSGGGGGHSHVAAGDSGTRYICPMMCTPPRAEPGRCPVCGMELVPLTSGGGSTDSRSIHIDPATRRVANIHTVAVTSMPMTRTIRAIGELNYDEGTLKTISAYVDGRLDRLYADYTGVVVKKGDHLALVYSPRLYSGQVELLLAKKSRQEGRTSTLTRVVQSNDDLYESAKERLILLGMTEMQIEHLEEAGEATSRLELCA
ncbi:MAG: efflux RND transporter periplasmic adaptor subunit, partial [Planctomycetota bacterium]